MGDGASANPQEGHVGNMANAGFSSQGDPRVSALLDYLLSFNPLGQAFTFLHDTKHTAQLAQQQFKVANPIQTGRIVYAHPGMHWYKVQLSGGGSSVACTTVTPTGTGPIGVRCTGVLAPPTDVIVYQPLGLPFGYILGTIPLAIAEGIVNLCDWVQQGSGAGMKREDAYMKPFELLQKGGDIKDWSCRRPIDSTVWDWGMMTESGIGLHIDPFQAFLRINEACGLFLNYWDHYMRLAAMNYDFQSPALQLSIRDDEGENSLIEGNITYPWEAVGLYAPGQEWAHEFPIDDVHYKINKGTIDLADGEEDLQPIYRFVEYGGYLGQAKLRMLMKPAQDKGKRQFGKNDKPDCGLWQESIALDGSYTMRSAKSVFIGRRVLIPVPKRTRLQEDQSKGDDARKENYKASGQFGKGDEHKVGDVDKATAGLLRVAGVLDLLTYNYNWKALHPFHYHTEDYTMWDESEMDDWFDSTQDPLDFGALKTAEYMHDPEPKKIKIDHRYGDVSYCQRESFFCLHEDGSIQLGDGYGAQITMSHGSITLDCPGSIMMMAGKRIVNLSWDSITRAKNSVDISASNHDVRIKAEGNLQMLAGNGGYGGVLVESKGRNVGYSYKDQYGEDVQSSGIVLLSKTSPIGVLGSDVYIASGVNGKNEGTISLDSAQGRQPITMHCRHMNLYVERALQIWHTKPGTTCYPTASHRFAYNTSMISGNLIVEKNFYATNGHVIAGKNVFADQKLVQRKGGTVFIHEGRLDTSIQQAQTFQNQFTEVGKDIFDGDYGNRWYADGRLGNADVLTPMGFSFRDPPKAGTQYKTEEFGITEPRWMQMVRLGDSTGGETWTETAVVANGQKTYPWPGKQKWTEDKTLLQYKEHTLFDDELGMSADRGAVYEKPQLSEWDLVAPDKAFKTIF